MSGTIVNFITILAGGSLGLLFHQKIRPTLGDRIMEGFGLFVIAIGLKGAFQGSDSILYILSLIFGALLGEGLGLDKKLDRFTGSLERRFGGEEGDGFREGFISTTILFCVGAMAIIGPLNGVLRGDNEILYVKAAMDGVTAFIFASNFGVSVLFSAGSVLLYQGGISLLAFFFKDFLDMAVIDAMSVLGSLLVAAIGINMLRLGRQRINVVNLLPAALMPLLLAPALIWLNELKDGILCLLK